MEAWLSSHESRKAACFIYYLRQDARGRERDAAKASEKTVHKFGQDVKWNTHRAINERNGYWVDGRRKKEYKWNHKL